jgi:hypothetical protein
MARDLLLYDKALAKSHKAKVSPFAIFIFTNKRGTGEFAVTILYLGYGEHAGRVSQKFTSLTPTIQTHAKSEKVHHHQTHL